MANALQRLRVLLPALWAGALIAIATVATPAPFATLVAADAARVVARVLAHEAHASLVLGVVLVLLERRAARSAAAGGSGSQFSAGVLLALGAVFCTVLGFYGVQPMMGAARAGQSTFTFAQLHAASAACYLVKTVLVLILAWRNAAVATGAPVKPASS